MKILEASSQVGMLKGEDLVGGEKSHSQVVFGQDDDVEARW